MTSFGYASATVTRPDGSQITKAGALLRDGVLKLTVGSELEQVQVRHAYTEGRKGWQVIDTDGNRWTVKRDGGCGCRG